MKKILLSSLLVGSLLFAGKIAIPMPASSLSVENAGQLSAIDAYQDGVGIYTVEQVGGTVIDNSEMNSLVYKYGAEAKATGINIKDYVLSSGNVAEKVLASGIGKFEPITPGNGTVCDDKNASTINDQYVNGVCVGEVPPVIYNDNGTIKCENATVGQSFSLDGISYLVVDNTTIRNNLGRVASICTSKVTDMNQLFISNTSFNEPLNHWDVSNVTNMRYMFYNATSFNQSLNNWNVSNVTNMGYVFGYASSFNQPLNNWDTFNVIDMERMFYNASSFNQSLNNWDVSNVTKMGYMFYYVKLFNQPLDNWNTGNVINMFAMFYGTTSFNQYIKNWNVSKVINSSSFRSSSALTLANSPF